MRLEGGRMEEEDRKKKRGRGEEQEGGRDKEVGMKG